MSELTTQFKKELKQKAHILRPLIIIGKKGLTESVIEEINTILIAHELIKINTNTDDKEERKQMATDICEKLHADLIQMIGKQILIWKKNKEPKA